MIMKNPHFLGWSPMFHWTDSKIRVHALLCVGMLALTLTSLLQRALHHKGWDLRLARMLELLGGIQEILLIYPKAVGEKKPHATPLSLGHRRRTTSTLRPAEPEPLSTRLGHTTGMPTKGPSCRNKLVFSPR